MKTKINIMKDYKEIPFEKEAEITALPESAIVTKLHTIARARKKTIHPESVADGDIVTLALESCVERYNKKMVPVTVGKNLFDPELETQMLGMQVGEERELATGDVKVKTRVLSISRNEFPEPTDEEFLAFAADQEELAAIKTVAEYVEYLKTSHKQEQRESAVFNAINEILENALEQVDFDFDEEELDTEYEKMLENYREEVRGELGKEFEELTEDDFKAYVGVADREEFKVMLRQGTEWQVGTVVWLAAINGKDSGTVTLEDEDAMDFSLIETYVRENIKFIEEE